MVVQSSPGSPKKNDNGPAQCRAVGFASVSVASSPAGLLLLPARLRMRLPVHRLLEGSGNGWFAAAPEVLDVLRALVDGRVAIERTQDTCRANGCLNSLLDSTHDLLPSVLRSSVTTVFEEEGAAGRSLAVGLKVVGVVRSIRALGAPVSTFWASAAIQHLAAGQD